MAIELSSTVYWIAGIVIGFIIYMWILPEEAKVEVKNFVRKYLFWIILVGAYFYFRERWGFFTDEDFLNRQANAYFLFIAITYLLGTQFLGRLRYETEQFIADGLHGSIADYPLETENKFLIFNLGSIKASGLHFSKGNAIAVIRSETGDFVGTNFISIARMKKITKERLPNEVLDAITMHNNYRGIDNIYYGWFDSDREEDYADKELEKLKKLKRSGEIHKLMKDVIGVENASIGDLVTMLEKMSGAYNKLHEQFSAVTSSTEGFVAHTGRLKKYLGYEKRRTPAEELEATY